MDTVCHNLDRVATIEIRGKGLPRGVISRLYEIARRDGPPLSLQCARALDEVCKRGGRIAIVTGVYDPVHFPNGESDGPLGAVALGRALSLHGANVSYLVEPELVEPMQGLAKVLGIECDCVPLCRDSEEANTVLADKFEAAVFIEKLGSTDKGVFHLVTGSPRPGLDARMGGFLDRMAGARKLTIGIGDGGNEIGFGKIKEAARDVVPFGRECLCPLKEGIVTCLQTDIVFPACTSNIGAYAVCAALGLLAGRPELVHTPQAETELIRATVGLNLIDGGSGKPREYVDGICVDVNAAIVRVMQFMVETYYVEPLRKF